MFLPNFSRARWIELDNFYQARLPENKSKLTHTENASLLYLLAEQNMANLIRVHTSTTSFLDVDKEFYGNALLASLVTGSKEAAQTFLVPCVVSHSAQNLLNEIFNRAYKLPEGLSITLPYLKQRTMLSYLVEFGQTELMTCLLESGHVDVNTQDTRTDWTPLVWATKVRNLEILVLLLDQRKIQVNRADTYGRTPLSWAAESGSDTVVMALLQQENIKADWKDASSRTPLCLAAM